RDLKSPAYGLGLRHSRTSRILVMQKGQITHSFLPDSSSQARIAEVVNG
ncbi:hypothetical protein PM017_05915, partial [Escherichia coli]|nr:hypothetical protein [Escherichia coli]